MIGTPREPRSCLARVIPVKMNVEQQKRTGWQNHGILAVAANDPHLGWPEREMIQCLAEKPFQKQLEQEIRYG